MNILKKNIIEHIFSLSNEAQEEVSDSEQDFTSTFFISICHQTDVGLLIIWIATILTI